MRQCLVSSILAIIIVIQATSDLVVLLLSASFCLMLAVYFWKKTGGISEQNKVKNSPAFNSIPIFSNALIIIGSMFLSVIYTQAWLDEQLSSRLHTSQTGSIISGLADVIECDYSRSGVERYQLKLISLNSSEQHLNLRKISVSRYLDYSKAVLGGVDRSEGNVGKSASRITKTCGFRVQFTAKLRAPYSFINPVGFDYEAWLLSKGMDATGYLTAFEVLNVEKTADELFYEEHNQGKSWTLQFVDLRQKGIERAAALPGFSGQVVPALLFGVSGYLDKKRWRDLQATGAIHLLVVSGLHVGFLVLLGVFMWRKLIQLELLIFSHSYSYLLRITPVFLLFICLLYAYMAGFGLAVQRAGLMLLITLLVLRYKSHWSLFDTGLWAMWLILMLNPLSSLSIGFWFSFMAVGSLIMTHIGKITVKQHDEKKRDIESVHYRNLSGRTLFNYPWIINSFKTLERVKCFVKPQWIVFIALMPFLWMFQQSQSVLSLGVNTVAIPLLALVILPLSILALLFGEGVFTEVLNQILTWFFGCLNILSTQTYWWVFKPHGYWLGAVLMIVLTLLMFKGFPFRRLSFIVLGIIYLLPLKQIDQRLVIFDVGQGLSVMGNGSSNWVYDTGAKFRSGFSLGETVVGPNVLAASSQSLDLLIISHSDNDHAGGEAGLRRKVNIAKVYAGQPDLNSFGSSSINNVDLTPRHFDCHQLDASWRQVSERDAEHDAESVYDRVPESEEGRWKWRVFNVQNNEGTATDNDMSCVVQFEINGIKILLPGDIAHKTEGELIALYGDKIQSDILVVAHHGSKTSSSRRFIERVSPKVAVISSGFKNTFKHPHASVVQRYRELGIPVYNTAYSGAVEIDLNAKLAVHEWRKIKSSVWRQ